VASPSEAAALGGSDGAGAARIHVLPTGVRLSAPTVTSDDRPSLVFTGTLGYPPNADAVRHFCRDVLPTIRRERPDVRLEIVGDGASRELVSTCGVAPGVEFLGFVPDVFDVLRRATLFVCPMRQGTGIKVKLLEAMACGLPVVASPIAVEGMPDARDGVHLRVARSAEDFARAVVTLLGDKEARARLGARGRELAAGYTWDRLGERVDRVCREEVERRRHGAGAR
jgi:glycosyltransferase involved in cell wall biosynthesis